MMSNSNPTPLAFSDLGWSADRAMGFAPHAAGRFDRALSCPRALFCILLARASPLRFVVPVAVDALLPRAVESSPRAVPPVQKACQESGRVRDKAGARETET